VRILFSGGNPSFIVLADGKRLNLGYMEQSIRRFDRSAEEYEIVRIPIEQFLQIINADSVEAQIGTLDFPLGEVQINAFRSLIGLPTKSLSIPALQAKPANSSSTLDLVGSIWEGRNFTLEFQLGGAVKLNLPRERGGSCVQVGDKIEMEFPYIDLGAVRGLGVGVVKGDMMVVKLKFYGLLAGQLLKYSRERNRNRFHRASCIMNNLRGWHPSGRGSRFMCC